MMSTQLSQIAKRAKLDRKVQFTSWRWRTRTWGWGMAADNDVLAIVWGETSSLSPKDGADATLARLHAVVATLAGAAKKRGLDDKLRKAPPPRIGWPSEATYQKLRTTADAVEARTWTGSQLPLRAVIWEVTATGAPRIEKPLPNAASWIIDKGVESAGDFVVGDGSDGRTYRLFVSQKAPKDDELPFISAASGSGLPEPETKNSYTKLAWTLGIAGVSLLIAGGAMSAWSGRSMSGARNSLTTTGPAYQYLLLERIATVCLKDHQDFPTGKQAEVCDSLLPDFKAPEQNMGTKKINWNTDKATSVLAVASACPGKPAREGCNTIWRAAVEVDQEQTWKRSYFGWMHTASAYLTGASSAAGSASILVPFVTTIVGMAGLVVALGLGTKRRAAGVWIDMRNRVSLARAQVTLWTVVALAGYMAFAMFNIGFAGIVASSTDFATYQAFPGIPASIAAALGIATVSPMLSALILPTKDQVGKALEFEISGGGADLRKRGVPFFGAESEGLDKRPSPALASIADIFMGEEKPNADTVDVARLQNVVITITLVLGFFSLLMGMMGNITPTTLLSAQGAVFTSLPELGATFTSLLLASHATYLVAKAHDAKG